MFEDFFANLPHKELIDILIYPILIIIMFAYNIYARRKKHTLKLPVGLFIFYFATMTVIQILQKYEFTTFLSTLELLSTIFLTLAVIRFITFILVDYLMRYKELAPIPVITRDIGLAFIYVVAILIILRYEAKVNLTSIITTSAVVTAVIGLALQDTLGNLIAGIVLQMEKPYNVGDWIHFDTYTGKVIGMSWKSTRIVTREREVVCIPNNLITRGHVLNYTQMDAGHIATFNIGTSYVDPPNRVREAILATLAENPAVSSSPAPDVRVTSYSDFYINYLVRFYITDFENEDRIKSQILNQLWYRFHREGITIPFPIRTIHHVKEEDVGAAEKSKTSKKALAVLKRVDIFKPLPENALDNISHRVGFQSFSPGEIIIREGQAGQSMYIIVYGECDIMISRGSVTDHVVATLSNGQFFGEMSLLTGEPRSATVKVKKDTLCLKIEKNDLQDIISGHPEVAEAISEILAKRKEDLEKQKESLDEKKKRGDTSLASQLLTKIKAFFSRSEA